MHIYDALNDVVIVKKRGLTANQYTDEIRNKLDSDEERNLFDLLKNISSLGYKIVNSGIAFYPYMIWEGKRTYAIEDITDDDYLLLESIDLCKVPLNLRARITDILWTQKKMYPAAIVAAESYLKLFEMLFKDDDWVGVIDNIKRAIYISAQVKKNDIYDDSCKAVWDHIVRINGEDEHFLSITLIEIVLEQSYGDLDVLIQILDNIITHFKDDINKVERAYELKFKCLLKKKDKTAVKEANLELAEYLVSIAEGIVNSSIQGAMSAERYFQKAIMIYRSNGETQKGELVHRRLVEVQKEIPKTMAHITTSIDLSKINDNINKNMDGLSFAECVIRLTQMITFYSKEDIKKQVFDDLRKHPLSHMFGKSIVNNTGQTILSLSPLDLKNPEENQELLNLHILQKMFELQKYTGNLAIRYAMYHIRERHNFELDDLNFLIRDNPIIPLGRERIFRSAIYMALKGQCYEALHILAPQVENLFRNIAKEVGGLTVTLENDGTSKEKVLSSIFDLPELMDCYDNDILFIFKGLLNDQAGANIRNSIAHGIIEEGDGNSGASLYFICAVIKLLLYTSVSCYDIVKRSEKLHSYVELKEKAIDIRTAN